MEEQLISFETAKLAKEKGFDEKVRAVFRVWHEVAQERKYQDRAYNYNGADWDGDKEQFYSRPTQSLLQKWLREKHELHLVVDHSKKGHYEVRLSDNSDNSISTELFGESFPSYEEALEAGLIVALKRI